MMMQKVTRIAAVAAACLTSTIANAEIVTRSYEITANDFSVLCLEGTDCGVPPLNEVTGRFTVTFDRSVRTEFSSVGVTVDFFPFVITDPVYFSYDNVNDDLGIGTGVGVSAAIIIPGFNQFNTYLTGTVDNNPRSSYFIYTTVDNLLAAYGTTSVSVRDITAAAVPEPTTWTLMIAGVGIMGGALRRRRFESVKIPATA